MSQVLFYCIIFLHKKEVFYGRHITSVNRNNETRKLFTPLCVHEIDGEPITTSRAIVTPAATATDPPTTENFFNVTSTAIITVPKGCCWNVSVENVTEPTTPTTPASPILVQNANLVVQRIA